MRFNVGLSVMSVMIFAATAHADVLSDAAGFCADPYTTICGPQDQFGKQYDQRLAVTRQAIHDQSERQVAAKYGYQPADDTGFDVFAKVHPDQAAVQLSDFLAFMRAGGMSQVGAEPLAWQGVIERQIMEVLNGVLDTQATLADAGRASFKSALGEVEVVDAGQIISQGEAHPLWPNFVYQCSTNGLRDNAFHPPGTQKVVLCPGLILAARPDSTLPASGQDMFGGTVWTLAHETGHSIDFGWFPEQYTALSSCVRQDYVRSGTLAGFAGLDENSQEWTDKYEGHLEEIVADTWANEVLARLVQAQGDPARGFALVRDSAIGLCGYRDDGVRYGSDRFRIGTLMGRNPRLRQALGCAPLPVSQSVCVFEGRE
jgi:hypothetical protein